MHVLYYISHEFFIEGNSHALDLAGLVLTSMCDCMCEWRIYYCHSEATEEGAGSGVEYAK